MSPAMLLAGASLIVNIVRLGFGQPAQSFHVKADPALSPDDFATAVGELARRNVTQPAEPGVPTLITLNIVLPGGDGGCSWQCLTVQRPIPAADFGKHVAAVVTDMAAYAVLQHNAAPAAAVRRVAH